MKLYRVCVAAIATTFILPLADGVRAKPTAMRFIDISKSPVASGMGQAGVALPNVAFSELNPAQVADCHGSVFNFSHTSWLGDICLESAGLVTGLGKHGLGLRVVGLFTSPLEGYDDDGIYQGDFRFFDICAEATYARKYQYGLAFGITGKTVYERIDWDAASGVAFDVGMSWGGILKAFGGDFNVGISSRNIGGRIGYHSERFDLPLSLQFGLAYHRMGQAEPLGLSIAVDYQAARTGESGMLLGLEATYDNLLAIRMGYMDAYRGRATFGLGCHLGRLTVDYSYMPFDYDLGVAHRFGLSLAVGSIFPSPESSK